MKITRSTDRNSLTLMPLVSEKTTFSPLDDKKESIDRFEKTSFKAKLNLMLKEQLSKKSQVSLPVSPEPESLQGLDETSSESAPRLSFGLRTKKLSLEQIDRIEKTLGMGREQFLIGPKSRLQLDVSIDDLKNLSKLDHASLCRAYWEGVGAVKGYCTMVDDQGTAIGANARRVLQEYQDYKRNHHIFSHGYRKEIYWLKKDYEAGTAGGKLSKDYKIYKAAQRFANQLKQLDFSLGDEEVLKQIQKIVQKSTHPAVVWTALQKCRQYPTDPI